jgi:iron complex outermembrane recepter protein
MNKSTSIPSTVLVASAIAAILAAPQVQAAQAPEAGLEEVVVTAERREQKLQDVPVAATVFTGEELARRGVTNLNDIQQVAPSIAINNVNRSVFVNIRGVGIAQSAPTSNPGVAYYIDGQLIPHEQFIGHSFYDIGAVEVLRGPQGTLTGQNSTGGAVYVRTPAPVYGEYFGGLEQTFSSYRGTRTIATANLGLNDNVALRLAGIHDSRNSYTTNLGPSGSTPGDEHLTGGRANLAMRTSDDRLRANLRLDFFRFRSDNLAVKNRTDTVSSNPYVIEEDGRAYLNQTGHRLSGEVRYALTEGIDVRALSSWQNGYTHDQTDGDRTATALPQPPTSNTGRVSFATTDFQTWIHEFNVLSTGQGPLQWVAGAFALRELVPVTLLRDNRHTTDFVVSNSTIITKARNVSDSVFGQVNYKINTQWEVLGGARYSKDSQYYNRIALPGPPLPAGTDRIGPPADSSSTTGKVGANYHYDDNSMLYATASKGYKAGGVNLTLGTPNFKPESNVVLETGIKSTLMDHRLRVNADVFHSDYKDIQLSSLSNGLPLTQNAASGKSWGAELEVTGKFGAFGFNAGLGYLNAQFAKSAAIVNTLTNLTQTVNDGDTLPFAPDVTFNAGIDYTVAIDGGTLTPRLQWSHVGEQLATPFRDVATVVPARDILDARLTYNAQGGWLVEAFVTNFANEHYIASQLQNSSSANGGIVYGAPRVIGLRAAVNFGK